MQPNSIDDIAKQETRYDVMTDEHLSGIHHEKNKAPNLAEGSAIKALLYTMMFCGNLAGSAACMGTYFGDKQSNDYFLPLAAVFTIGMAYSAVKFYKNLTSM